jgi:hypothetical protein
MPSEESGDEAKQGSDESDVVDREPLADLALESFTPNRGGDTHDHRESKAEFGKRVLVDGTKYLLRMLEHPEQNGLRGESLDSLRMTYKHLNALREEASLETEQGLVFRKAADYGHKVFKYLEQLNRDVMQIRMYTEEEETLPEVEAPLHYSPKKRNFLSDVPPQKLELMLDMFDRDTGFGNPSRYKVPVDNGYTAKPYLERYLRLVGSAIGTQEASLQQLWERLRPSFDNLRNLLGPTASSKIRAMLHGVRSTPAKPLPILEPPTPLEVRRAYAPFPGQVYEGVNFRELTRSPQVNLDKLAYESMLRWHVAPGKERLAVQAHLNDFGEDHYPDLSDHARLRKALQHKNSRNEPGSIAREYLAFWQLARKLNHLPSDPKEYLGDVAGTKLEEGIRIPHNLKVERGDRHASYNLDLAPIGSEPSGVGVVHLVSMDPISADIARVGSMKGHFLQKSADSNMSRLFSQPLHSVIRGNVSIQQRSRIMKRSAHILYRRQGNSLVITVLQGVSTYELNLLVGKLGGHRASTTESVVSLAAPKRQSLGSLDRLDLEKFRDRLEKILEDHNHVRFLITDKKEKGILHKPSAYTRKMEHAMRQRQLVI